MTSQNPLRIRAIKEMRIRNLSTETQRNYIHYLAEFAKLQHEPLESGTR